MPVVSGDSHQADVHHAADRTKDSSDACHFTPHSLHAAAEPDAPLMPQRQCPDPHCGHISQGGGHSPPALCGLRWAPLQPRNLSKESFTQGDAPLQLKQVRVLRHVVERLLALVRDQELRAREQRRRRRVPELDDVRQ